MSNDTSYSLEFRHPKKGCLEEVKIYLSVVKPAISRFCQNMKFTPEWSAKQRLELLGIRKWSEVVTWFGSDSESMIIPSFGSILKQGDSYVLEVGAGANEGGCNVWISGPDGELADLLERFPGLEISGEFSDQYGEGRIEGFEKIHELDAIQSGVRDPCNWEEEECAAYSDATKELLVRCYEGELDLKHLRRLLKQGADVNATWIESSFMEILLPPVCGLADREVFVKALTLILKSGWRYEPLDPCFNEKLIQLAGELQKMETARQACRSMAAVLLGRKPGKEDEGAKLFQDSIKARDVRGLLASAFLGADFDAEVTKVSKADRAWLKRQGL